VAASFEAARLPRHAAAPTVQLGALCFARGDMAGAQRHWAAAAQRFAADGWAALEFALQQVCSWLDIEARLARAAGLTT
jgi:hypothetical protein